MPTFRRKNSNARRDEFWGTKLSTHRVLSRIFPVITRTRPNTLEWSLFSKLSNVLCSRSSKRCHWSSWKFCAILFYTLRAIRKFSVKNTEIGLREHIDLTGWGETFIGFLPLPMDHPNTHKHIHLPISTLYLARAHTRNEWVRHLIQFWSRFTRTDMARYPTYVSLYISIVRTLLTTGSNCAMYMRERMYPFYVFIMCTYMVISFSRTGVCVSVCYCFYSTSIFIFHSRWL